MGANELAELLTAMSVDAVPLSQDELDVLLRVVARLEDPDERVVGALYRQSVARATGQYAPAPLKNLHNYADLIQELAEYLPGASVSNHPVLECCALLTGWFPSTPGMHELRSVVYGHIGRRSHGARARPSPSVVVLVEPGYPSEHFLVTIWCYYDDDDIELTYRSPEASTISLVHQDVRRELAYATDRVAQRRYPDGGAALVEFVVPVELLPEDWPTGTLRTHVRVPPPNGAVPDDLFRWPRPPSRFADPTRQGGRA